MCTKAFFFVFIAIGRPKHIFARRIPVAPILVWTKQGLSTWDGQKYIRDHYLIGSQTSVQTVRWPSFAKTERKEHNANNIRLQSERLRASKTGKALKSIKLFMNMFGGCGGVGAKNLVNLSTIGIHCGRVAVQTRLLHASHCTELSKNCISGPRARAGHLLHRQRAKHYLRRLKQKLPG